MSKERRLGRGLEALLGRAGLDPQSTPAPAQTQGTGALAAQYSPLPGRAPDLSGKGIGGWRSQVLIWLIPLPLPRALLSSAGG